MPSVYKHLITAICQCKRAPNTQMQVLTELHQPNQSRNFWWWDGVPPTIQKDWPSLSAESKLVAMYMGGLAVQKEVEELS